MAKHGSGDVGFLLVDGYDVLGVTTSLKDQKTAMTDETTPLGATDTEYASVSLTKASISQEGFFDDAADSSNDALVDGNGTSRVIVYGVEGNTIGKRFAGFAGAMQATYDRIASKGALTRANATYESSGAVEEGIILHAHGAETAAGDTTDSSVDNSASTSDGGSAYLAISSLTLGGYTNLAVKVRDSADDVTYADLVSFTAVTDAPTAERKTVAGTVERYLAASWSFTGTGSSPSAKFVVGFARN